ncbi:S41 family peptidase [Flavobacterium kingsejongi]|uniref:Peptidase S41 n=1 Tax=Flavobacterium kingsejongi TaxID=1678728 RepID=A0A2S1LK70_9FLAO|nr:S41 family peptidase [Flavobacterium kingsejongi]AWG24145.1 peptidase S41 [Flavobacterium kingsejongi]
MKMNTKYVPIMVCGALALGILIGGKINFSVPATGFTTNATNKGKLNRLIDFIENDYVDNVNTDSIIDITVNDILAQLDPHSVYINSEDLQEVSQSMRGDFVGIGVNFYMYKDTLAVIKTVEGGPSEKAGIKSGDRILMADNDVLFGRKLPNDSLFPKLKGAKDSEVTLTIYRKEENRKFKVRVKRDVVPIKSVDISAMLDKNTGYIKINRFAETTYSEFRRELVKLKGEGATRLVIDLRENGGGYLEEAVRIADELLKDETLIVMTKNKGGKEDKTYATEGGIFETGKLAILINENSASASEILAGAIQDNDRGTIIGRRSFGKGLVQREMPLGDGSAVRLTVARYYTPTGRSIQKSYDHGAAEYFKEFGHRYETGELYAADSIKIADTLKFKTPKGKIVYGGGGIVPDVFVPLEGKHGDESIGLVMQSGIVSYFVFEQLDKDRKQFEGVAFPDFLLKMDKNDTYFTNFKKYLKNNGVTLPLDHNKGLVKRYLTAEFARQLYGEKEYYQIILKEDAMVKKALDAKTL